MPGFSRRAFLTLGGAGLLAACDTGYDDFQFGAIKRYYDVYFARDEGLPITREQIEKQPYAMIHLRTPGNAGAVLVLARVWGRELHWISADRNIVATLDGRLVRTVGLPENIRETRSLGVDPVASGLHRITAGTKAKRIMDFDDEQRYGRIVTSRYTPIERQKVTIADLTYDLLLVVERNRIAADDWEFENRFWVDPNNGFVWKSLQHVSPRFDPFEIAVLKPAAI
ncbi:MAG: YjbF family lipoprotein [Alphaproteobacteria bacterium]